MRADAQRNYDRLLLEARQAFIVHGTDVALEDIARHAGVGIGTLYRHFPSRYDLMNAVFLREIDQLAARAEELMSADDPTEGLVGWLQAVAVHSTAYRGMAAAIVEASETQMPACKASLRASGGSLLARAQRAGAVREDITIGDLLKLTYAIVQAAEKDPAEKGVFQRLMSLAVDGMRPRPAGDAFRAGGPHGASGPVVAAAADAPAHSG
ncbi:transcriptional regulator, TetR family [Actinacidiphila yanglinensis]|uniref:Transcriptional regulator, TetR family n=1 Tax=Actinacidiphila yanglinensis TaxID=310779 RepID=A0A1H6BL42_9ACTN|nr:TetR/AcrR family transcriptional regulator [Actinacidiphila yanglinensis]SEG61441.1 transcriptional regulator, TetR family [Actinacidiphila yanglinensis]